MKLLKKVLLITIFSTVLTIGTNFANDKVEYGKIWAAVTYEMAEEGFSNEMTTGVGIAGALQSGLYGAAAGAAFGGPVGFAVGFGISL